MLEYCLTTCQLSLHVQLEQK
uniref:Uncharacterized protein n=1 Tax=Rhizophora mucronata TaxID=61149 RepID=A0A2P2IJR0_RHIMU